MIWYDIIWYDIILYYKIIYIYSNIYSVLGISQWHSREIDICTRTISRLGPVLPLWPGCKMRWESPDGAPLKNDHVES